jgi:tRNA(fMet)-specific endonuclease VapC
MIGYLFDTDICVLQIRRRRAENVLARMAAHPAGSFAISTITIAELQCGVAKSQDPAANLAVLTQFLAPFVIVHFDAPAAAAYGPLRAGLERSGISIGPLDTLIAAHALALKLILITNNEREFRRVPGLRVENWTRP